MFGMFWCLTGFSPTPLCTLKSDADLIEAHCWKLGAEAGGKWGWKWSENLPCLSGKGFPYKSSNDIFAILGTALAKLCNKEAGRWIRWPTRLFPSLTCNDFMKALCQLFTNYCVLSSDQSCQTMVWEVRFSYKFLTESLWNLKIE